MPKAAALEIPKKQVLADQNALLAWYRSVRRELPWRINRDPYRIWISEIMLQQTTVAAVVPFYNRFMEKFPKLAVLAAAPTEDVLEAWAGLGYYSRARNLHKAAKELATRGFPRTAVELEQLSGFGPYTSRAVASLAFDEKTGVLDGNVIRILSRRYGLSLEWWKPAARNELQVLADALAQVDAPADLNQGMMELGAMICTPKSPACLMCPWITACVARKTGQIEELPLKKPRRDREIWHWQPQIVADRGRVMLMENDYAPFLRGHLVPPGQVTRLKTAPKDFSFKGTVTHHDIFVAPTVLPSSKLTSGAKWVDLTTLKKVVPASLIRKAIELALESEVGRPKKKTAKDKAHALKSRRA